MSSMTITVEGALREYLLAHGNLTDDLQRELIAETLEKTHGAALMQICPEQGALMQLLAGISGAKRAVEVGTFTGYSALCVARGLPEDGTLLCCDVNEEWTSIGRAYWERAGVAHKITLTLGPAVDTLQALPENARFDLAFIDADKTNYAIYYEEILKRMDAGGIILIDNVLWLGRVIDETADDEDTVAIRKLNDFIVQDARVDVVMLPIGDGLTLVTKK